MNVIQLQDISLYFPHKTCFADFSTQVQWGERIGIVGDNGSGKSCLLRLLAKQMPPSEGQIICDPQWRIGHVVQILDADTPLSGGQRVNQALSQALANFPDVLLLDEPSNHLDTANSTSMLRMEGPAHRILMDDDRIESEKTKESQDERP